MKLILLFGLFSTCLALRFSHVPITVDTEVILVNQPAKLKCNYVKFRTETVREINWYIAYTGFSSKIFHYHVTTGKKENSIYSHIRTQGQYATDEELSIVLPEYRGSPVTIGCEVEVLRDNGYGTLSHSKKMAEANVTVVDTSSHILTVKNGKWDQHNMGNLNPFEASVGSPLLVSCISRNANPSPNLTLYLNDQPWTETSATSRVDEITIGVASDSKVIEGRMDTVYDSMFQNGVMNIECKSTFKDFLFEKKQLGLRKAQRQIVSDYPQRRPGLYAAEEPRRYGGYNQNNNGGRQEKSYNTDNDMIHARLLDLLDPAKHMHPGIPYDFYSGYILMVAKNVDVDDNEVSNTRSYYGNRGQPTATTTTHLYGKLPDLAVSELQRNYGTFRKVSDQKCSIEMNPVDVLNLLGNYGFRVIGFTAEADQKMVWTLEERDFEKKFKQNNGQNGHHHGSRGHY